MNNENPIPGSNPSAAHQTVTVYCTRPRFGQEGAHPHANQIPAADILDKAGRRQLVCRICGMPLILGEGKRYVPIERLGSGGFGVTFVARDINVGSSTILNRPKRVIKQLCPVQQLPPTLLEKVQKKFEGEAEVLAQLHHPNIPTLYEYFEEEATDSRLRIKDEENKQSEEYKQRFFYLVQQYIDGIDLEKALSQQGAFSEQEIETFLRNLLKILNDIHSGNHHSSRTPIIHRDIKPANIICATKEVVSPDGTVDRLADLNEGRLHLIDFGAVKEVVQVIEQQVPNQASVIVSHGFSPPEQISRRPVGFFSDLYALGATCINLLTAKNPSDLNLPDDFSIWKNHASVSSEFAAILDRMLASRSEDRYQTAGEVLQALDQMEEKRRIEVEERQKEEENKRRITTAAAHHRAGQRQKVLLVGGLASLGLLVLGMGLKAALDQPRVDAPAPAKSPSSNSATATSLVSAGDEPIANSSISLSGEYETLKQEGIRLFAAGDYEKARDTFADIREQAKAEWNKWGENLEAPYGKALQDPTVLIYQNNAEVRLRHEQGEPIYTVAAAVPLNINVGKLMLFGIAQAQDQAVNPSGGGEPVNLEIVVANDRNDPKQAERIAKSLTEERFDGRPVLAIVGHYISDSTCAALRAHYASAKIPVVSPLSTAANLRQDCGGDDWFFRTTSSTKVEAATLVDYLTDQIPRPKVAIFYNKEDAFSRNLFNEFQSALNAKGGETVEAPDLSVEIDIAATLERVEEVDALAVLPDGRTRTDVAFNRAVAVIKANQGRKLILGSNPLYDQSVVEQAGRLADLKGKLILATDWYRECALAGRGLSFVNQAEQEYWFGGVNRTTALSYEAVQAVQATLTPGITATQIQQKLATATPIQSAVFANETISFDANGDRRELTRRILTTPGQNPRSPFDLVQGCSR